MTNMTFGDLWAILRSSSALRAATRSIESELDPRLDAFYRSGERVELLYRGGTYERGYIGRSTGTRPVYLLLKLRTSTGGGPVARNSFISVRGLGVYKDGRKQPSAWTRFP